MLAIDTSVLPGVFKGVHSWTHAIKHTGKRNTTHISLVLPETKVSSRLKIKEFLSVHYILICL